MMLPVAATALPQEDALERAVAAMGGRALLTRVKSLGWTGRLYEFTPEGGYNEMVMTTFEPFRSSWTTRRIDVASNAEAAIEQVSPDGAWERAGEKPKVKMEPDRTAAQRAMLGLYSYMLLIHAPATPGGGMDLQASKPGYPAIKLKFGREGLSRALYSIDGSGQEMLIEFEDVISDQGLHWPSIISFFRWYPGEGRTLHSRLTIGNLFVDLA